MIMNFYLTFSDVKENQQKSSKNQFNHDLVYRVIWNIVFRYLFRVSWRTAVGNKNIDLSVV